LGNLIGFLWFDVFRIRRQIVIDNLGKAFPEKSVAERTQMGRENLRFLGRELVEYAQLPFLNKQRVAERFVMHGLENVDAARKKGKGVCLLTLHLGYGDLTIAAVSVIGYPLYLVAKEMSAGWLNRLLLKARERVGTVFIPPRNTAYAILKALKRNEVVIFVQDQFMGPPIGCPTVFFGHPTGSALGLAVMAQRSQAPVIPIYTYVDENDKIHAVFEKEIPFVGDPDDPLTLQRMTQRYSDQLEKYILRHPTQWMWIHRRWKKFSV
jgi:KDO2-lipid IV(A) lauroyltransferase